MHSPSTIQVPPAVISPDDSEQVKQLKTKMNEVIKRLDEVYRMLWGDVKIMDFRELPPSPQLSHSRWKFVEDHDTGDLDLWHKTNGIWVKSGWNIIGDIS